MYIKKNPSKKHLSFQSLIAGFISKWQDFNDKRRANSIDYTIQDTVLSALACMFYKSESMLSFQRRMESRYKQSNLKTQFGVNKIPKDNQMRAIIGSINSEHFAPVFEEYLHRMQRGNYLAKYQIDGRYLITIDGTEYFSSKTISCNHCLTQEHRNGSITYSHKVVQPIISHPDYRQILPLMPEEISNTDGQEKQDSEISAAKRLLPKIRAQHPRMPFIWMGDSLYATSPFIEEIRKKDDKFIFRVKEGNHKALYTEIKDADFCTFKISNKRDGTLLHKWVSNVRLNNSSNIMVNVMRLFVVSENKDGSLKSVLVGTWITDIDLNENNIAELVRAARARWKIENECFNILKNHGYDLAHNWGHQNGESFNFYILIMLAFYMHQILDLTDKLFQRCRQLARTYKDLWNELSFTFRRRLYSGWEEMLDIYIKEFMEAHSPDPPIKI